MGMRTDGFSPGSAATLAACFVSVVCFACGGSGPTGAGGGATGGARGSGGASKGRSCAMVLASSWDTGSLEKDLASSAAWAAFQALDTCACVHMTTSPTPGCEDLCTEQLVQHTPTNDMCAGAPPSAACKTCLAAHCSAELAACGAS
jgi:hypothetical protein